MQDRREMEWGDAQSRIRALEHRCKELETARDGQHAESASLAIAISAILRLLPDGPELGEALSDAIKARPVDNHSGYPFPTLDLIEDHLRPLLPDRFRDDLPRAIGDAQIRETRERK